MSAKTSTPSKSIFQKWRRNKNCHRQTKTENSFPEDLTLQEMLVQFGQKEYDARNMDLHKESRVVELE